MPSEIARRFLDVCRQRRDREILCTLKRGKEELRFTGGGLAEAAEARAAQLGNMGAGVLVLALPPGPVFLTTLFGCLLAGITLVPVSPPRRGSASDRLTHIVRDCGAAAVLCTSVQEPAIREALAGIETPVVVLADAPEDALPSIGSAPSKSLPAAIVQYTSGSTKDPKGVLITGDNILANCDLVMRSWQMDERCRFVNWMPHFHDMGLMGGILYPLLSGGFSVQMSPYDFVRSPRLWLKAISDWRATFSGGPAFAFADLVKRVSADDLDGLDLSTWERGFCGAEPVPPGLLEAVARHLAPARLRREALFSCYGMAEMTLFAAGLPEDAGHEGNDRPAPSHACRVNGELAEGLRIVDPDTRREVVPGAEGEIWLKGPSKGLGYLNLAGESEAAFRARLEDGAEHEGDGQTDAYLRTGDLGRIEGDRLFISGRSKDILISHGRKMSAAEVEWVTCAPHRALNPLAAAAFMADDGASGEAVLAVEAADGGGMPEDREAIESAIRALALGEWGLTLTAVHIVPRGRLPRTTSGKIRRRQVAQDFRNGLFDSMSRKRC